LKRQNTAFVANRSDWFFSFLCVCVITEEIQPESYYLVVQQSLGMFCFNTRIFAPGAVTTSTGFPFTAKTNCLSASRFLPGIELQLNIYARFGDIAVGLPVAG